MQSSKLGYQVWVIAMYLLSTNLKSVSSMKLHRDLNITQKSAWHLAHRIRQAAMVQPEQFEGPVEVDETYMGGQRKNMHNVQRNEMTGRGVAGKVAVAGIKDRNTNQVVARWSRRPIRPPYRASWSTTWTPRRRSTRTMQGRIIISRSTMPRSSIQLLST